VEPKSLAELESFVRALRSVGVLSFKTPALELHLTPHDPQPAEAPRNEGAPEKPDLLAVLAAGAHRNAEAV
jgi:hypothetical protein